MKFKVLHTEWSDGLGGQEKRILAELAGMSDRGHYVALACREHARIKEEAKKLSIDIFILPMRNAYDLTSIIKLTSILRKIKFDIVNTHSGIDSWIGGIATKMAKTPILIRTRHLNIPLRRNIFNFIHYLPDVYITCGENMRNNLIQNCDFPPEKVVSIPTGISNDFFEVEKNPDLKIKYGIRKDSVVISNVGILRSVKGQEITLKAAKYVLQRFPDVVFFFAGDGPKKKYLEDLAHELGLSSNVIFAGFIKNITDVYSFSDIIVLSSWSEGLPQSLLQAMASGVPVVATCVGGVPEVVIHEKTGLLVNPGDYMALSNSIIRIIEDKRLSSLLVEEAKKLVIDKHSEKHMLDEIENLYYRLSKN
jgi:glycosyltransferase involved in cell wall biosynthesis